MENNNWWTRNKKNQNPRRLGLPDIGADFLKQERETLSARRALSAGQANQNLQQISSTGTTENDFVRQQAEIISRVSEYKANPVAFKTKYGNEQAQVMDTISKQLEINGFDVSKTKEKEMPGYVIPREYLSEKDLPQEGSARAVRSAIKTIWGLDAEGTQKKADEIAKNYLPAPDARFLGFPIGKATRSTLATIVGLGEPSRPDLLGGGAGFRAAAEAGGLKVDPTKAVQFTKEGKLSVDPSLAVTFDDSSFVKQALEGNIGLTGENSDAFYQGIADVAMS